jgi:hypothetical protein
VRVVAEDDARVFEVAHSAQTRGWCEPDVVGEFSVCLARIGLKVADDGLIDRIHGESMLDLASVRKIRNHMPRRLV